MGTEYEAEQRGNRIAERWLCWPVWSFWPAVLVLSALTIG